MLFAITFGVGEKKPLRLVARYADARHIFAYAGAEAVRQKLDILKAHCDALGCDYDTIERMTLDTATIGMGGTATQMIERCQQMAAVGVSMTRAVQ